MIFYFQNIRLPFSLQRKGRMPQINSFDMRSFFLSMWFLCCSNKTFTNCTLTSENGLLRNSVFSEKELNLFCYGTMISKNGSWCAQCWKILRKSCHGVYSWMVRCLSNLIDKIIILPWHNVSHTQSGSSQTSLFPVCKRPSFSLGWACFSRSSRKRGAIQNCQSFLVADR